MQTSVTFSNRVYIKDRQLKHKTCTRRMLVPLRGIHCLLNPILFCFFNC